MYSVQEHHYQPGYTLVGGSLYKLQQCIMPMKCVLHPDNVWIKQAAKKINPHDNSVELRLILLHCTKLPLIPNLSQKTPEIAATENSDSFSNFNPHFAFSFEYNTFPVEESGKVSMDPRWDSLSSDVKNKTNLRQNFLPFFREKFTMK